MSEKYPILLTLTGRPSATDQRQSAEETVKTLQAALIAGKKAPISAIAEPNALRDIYLASTRELGRLYFCDDFRKRVQSNPEGV